MNNEAFDRFLNFLKTIRMGWLVPFFLLAKGEKPSEQGRAIMTGVVFPLLAIGLLMAVWAVSSKQIITKFGAVPGPAQVRSAWGGLMNEIDLEQIKKQDHVQRQRESRIKYLDMYASVLEAMPGGVPELANLGAATKAVEEAAARFEDTNELLEVQNKISIVESIEAATDTMSGFKHDSARQLGETLVAKLLPLEIGFREAEKAFNFSTDLNPPKEDSEPAIARKASARKAAAKELAGQKSTLLVARQQMVSFGDATV